MGFWDGISNQNVKSNGFNIQDFMKFYNENKNSDMNQVLQNMIRNGNVTQEQLNQATTQAQNVYSMMKGLGIVK